VDKLINKRELPYALVRAILGMVIMYHIFLGTVGSPQERFQLAMGTMFATLAVVFLSVLMPERSAAGSWFLYLVDIGIAGVAVSLLGGAGGLAGILFPALAVSAAFRFEVKASGAATVALAAGVFGFARLTGFHGSPYQLCLWAALMLLCWSIAAQIARSAEERKYRMMYLDQERINSELEERIKELEKKLQSQTIVDPVTGLKNFRYFRARIDEEILRARRKNAVFSLALLEIDGLPAFVSLYGEEGARKALQKIAARLKDIFRTTDLISRYSEAQFLIMMPETDARNTLIPIMRFRKKIAADGFGPDNRFDFGLSFGVSSFPADAQEVGGLLSLATAALRRSKEKGAGMTTLAYSLFKKPKV
jgi:diguanylate cyclase (GGDEF)-like protein